MREHCWIGMQGYSALYMGVDLKGRCVFERLCQYGNANGDNLTLRQINFTSTHIKTY